MSEEQAEYESSEEMSVEEEEEETMSIEEEEEEDSEEAKARDEAAMATLNRLKGELEDAERETME